MLSGGERNRLLLARLFARPANLIVLDEPTNDLDIESLELLEQTLQDYAGTLLLVSHDRAFLDNVVTQTIAAEGDGVWREYVGGYSDWVRQRRRRDSAAPAQSAVGERAARAPQKSRARMSYKAQRELDVLPADIQALEHEQTEIAARMLKPDYFAAGPQRMHDDRRRTAELEALLREKYARWEALEAERSRLA
jgi:ATP-binding cassette subfamily F protein uup